MLTLLKESFPLPYRICWGRGNRGLCATASAGNITRPNMRANNFLPTNFSFISFVPILNGEVNETRTYRNSIPPSRNRNWFRRVPPLPERWMILPVRFLKPFPKPVEGLGLHGFVELVRHVKKGGPETFPSFGFSIDTFNLIRRGLHTGERKEIILFTVLNQQRSWGHQ